MLVGLLSISHLNYRSTAIGVFLALASGVTAAAAQQAPQPAQIGTLECRGGASVGFVVGSETHLGCILHIKNMNDDHYEAVIQKVGLDIGITETTKLAWAVISPILQPGRGDIAGTYVGVDASAAAGLGVGGNALVGGSNNSIALQPLSVEGETGVSVAAGLERLELRPDH